MSEASPGSLLDLVCLVADENMRQTLLALLGRRATSLGIPRLHIQIPVHPEHDPGCFGRSPDFLRSFARRARYAIVLFDREGCGHEGRTRDELERDLESRLQQAGWDSRVVAIAIDPELEAWVWSESPHVDEVLGWKNRTPELRSWLTTEKYLPAGRGKPERPKEAMEEALFQVRRPRSSALYRQLADKVGLERCVDPAFTKLKGTLRTWFGTRPETG